MRPNARIVCSLLVAAIVLAAAPAAFAKPQIQLKYFFTNNGVQPNAQGKVLLVVNKAQSMLTIQVSGLTPGAYDVVLNSAVVDTINVNSEGKGKLVHKTSVKRGVTTLPYDVRGGDLSIQAAGTDMLTANVPATPAEAQSKIVIQTSLTNLGVVAGSATSLFKSRFGRSEFQVTVTGAAPGTYDLLVGSTVVGQIVVGPNGIGSIEFDTRPSSDDDDGGLDLLMTFDPRGQMVEVGQAGVMQLSVSFPTQ